MMSLPDHQNCEDMCIRLDTTRALDRQTDEFNAITISRSARIACLRAIKICGNFSF